MTSTRPPLRMAYVGEGAGPGRLADPPGVLVVEAKAAELVVVTAHAKFSGTDLNELAARSPAILAVDAPGSRVEELAEGLDAAPRIVGWRATAEGDARGVIEIASGPRTARSTLTAASAIAQALGAAVVHAPDREHSIESRLRAHRPTSRPGERPELEAWERFLIECGRLLDESAASWRDLARITRHGWGWDHGPLRLADRIAGPRSEFAQRLGATSYSMRRQARAGRAFDAPPVTVRLDADRATLTLCRAHTLNALDPELLAALDEAFTTLEANDDIHTVVFASEASAFLAGVDAHWIVDRIEDDDFDSIARFVARGQALFTRIARGRLSTAVKLEGMAAGAGAELLCCVDHVVATSRASVVFPETAIGIAPALGGSQRLPRRIGLALARWMILGGKALRAEEARELGLVDEVVRDPAIDAALDGWKGGSRRHADELPALALHEGTLTRRLERGQREFAALAPGEIKRGAPLALATADRLLRSASEWSIDEGLAAEAAALRPIFDSEDALRGLRARAEGRRFTRFEGR